MVYGCFISEEVCFVEKEKAVLTEKKAVVSELKDKLVATKGAVLTNYRGLTVAMDTKMRRKLREAGVEYRVVKNTMTRFAAKDAGIEGLDKYLEGPTAIALSETDPVAPAKILSDFIRENKLQALEIKAGLVEGKVIDAGGVKALATLPPREVLVATLLGTMQAPISGFVRALNGVPSNLVYALEAIRKQKEQTA
jgi:large subunit ribosomal protein L10